MINKRKERMLADCLDNVTSKRRSIDDCIREFPEIEEELRMAMSLQDQFLHNNDEVVSDIQRRLVKAKILANLPDRNLPVTKTGKPRYILHKLKRRFSMSWIIIISTIITLVSGGGVVYASGDALPGDVLYPVKTWIEDVRLAAASDETDVGLQFKFAERRLEEIESLLASGELDELDDAVLGYGNQVGLMTQTMAKIKAQDPDEAIRLRTELETKLQDQARRMEELLDETDDTDEFVRERVRLMLQTNTQLRERIYAAADVPEDEGTGDEAPVVEDVSDEEPTGAGAGAAQNQNGKSEIEGEIDGEAGSFHFNLGGQGGNGVYAMISGTRFECSVDGEVATCPAAGAPNKGDLCLYDAKTNQLLFTYTYEYEFAFENGWQGEKNDNGNNGSMGGGDEGSKESNQNNKGK